MAFYGDAVMNAASSDHRLRANDSLSTKINEFLSHPGSFQIGLADVPWISVQQNEDSTFRILTWQINVQDSLFLYEGRIQFETDSFITLSDDKKAIEPLFRSFDQAHWYGCRYYKLKTCMILDKQVYLLFGFNAHSRWNRQKIVDVLYFENGQPIFGMPAFTRQGKDLKRYGAYRLIITYSLDSRVTLDYDENIEMIVHDHLIPMQGRFPGQGETQVGDGSFEGYKQNENGAWIHHEKLFNQTSDNPLDNRNDSSQKPKKDIFGRDRQ